MAATGDKGLKKDAIGFTDGLTIALALGEVSERYFTPVVSTVAIGVLAVIWYLPSKLVSESFLFDSLSALAPMIAWRRHQPVLQPVPAEAG